MVLRLPGSIRDCGSPPFLASSFRPILRLSRAWTCAVGCRSDWIFYVRRESGRYRSFFPYLLDRERRKSLTPFICPAPSDRDANLDGTRRLGKSKETGGDSESPLLYFPASVCRTGCRPVEMDSSHSLRRRFLQRNA